MVHSRIAPGVIVLAALLPDVERRVLFWANGYADQIPEFELFGEAMLAALSVLAFLPALAMLGEQRPGTAPRVVRRDWIAGWLALVATTASAIWLNFVAVDGDFLVFLDGRYTGGGAPMAHIALFALPPLACIETIVAWIVVCGLERATRGSAPSPRSR